MLPTRHSSARPQHSYDGDTAPRELLVAPGVYAYYGWKNISIGIWVGQAVKSAVAALIEMGLEQAPHFPEGRSSIVFVLDQLPAPTPEAQEVMARLYAAGGLVSTAVILEGTGFWASGIRSMTTNVRRAAATEMHLGINTSIDEVMGWFPAIHLERTGVMVRGQELARVLTELRTQGAARAMLPAK